MAEYGPVPVDDVWAWARAFARWLRAEGFCLQTSHDAPSEVERTFASVDHSRVELVEKAQAIRDALAWLWMSVIPAVSDSDNPFVEPLPLAHAERAPTPERELAKEARALLGKIRALRKRVDEVAAIRNERAQALSSEPGMHLQHVHDDALDGFEALMAAISPLWMDSGILALPIPYSLQEWKEGCAQLEVALKVAGFQDAEIDAIVPGAGGVKAIAQRRYRHQKRMAEEAAANRRKALRKELVGLSAITRARVLSALRNERTMGLAERDAEVKALQRLGLLACALTMREVDLGPADRTVDEDA